MNIIKQQQQNTSTKSLTFSQKYPNSYVFTQNWLFSLLTATTKLINYANHLNYKQPIQMFTNWIIPGSFFLPFKDLIRNHLFQRFDSINRSDIKNILGVNFIAPFSVNLVNFSWSILKKRYGWNHIYGTNLKYDLKIEKRRCVEKGENMLLYKFRALKMIFKGTAPQLRHLVTKSLVFCIFDTIQQFMPQNAKFYVLPNIILGATLQLTHLLFNKAYASLFSVKNINQWMRNSSNRYLFVNSLSFGAYLSLYEMLKNLWHEEKSKQ